MSYLIGLAGMWLLCDGQVSLSTYVGRPGQSWKKDHSIRIIRCLIGVMLMIAGWLLS